MIILDAHWLCPLTAIIFILYAEIHYRIPWLPNRLFLKEPEIIFDAPWRIERGTPLPVLLLIKDAHRYPIEMVRVRITIHQNKQMIYTHEEKYPPTPIRTNFWHHIFTCIIPENVSGVLYVEAQIFYIHNGSLKIATTDNYRRTSHAPLKVLVDDCRLPGEEQYFFGELHYHSHYTDDQVEFGAPIDAAQIMAKAQGLSFLATTDHSYDLDDCVDNFLINDANLPKWQQLLAFVEEWNQKKPDFIVLQGEELSAGNRKRKNVHLLLINNDCFFVGRGDSAEKWLQTKPDWSVKEVLDHLEEKALAFAAHPTCRPSILQRMLFNRDAWSDEDYLHPRLTGMQIWNGQQQSLPTQIDLQTWIKPLLKGKRAVLIAGNDAHGNFNRSRQIRIPFWQMEEKEDHVFGKIKTGIRKFQRTINREGLLSALKNGCCVITNGPTIDMRLLGSNDVSYFIGDICGCEAKELQLEAQSSPTFGGIEEITLFLGNREAQQEERKIFARLHNSPYQQTIRWPHPELPKHGYIRAEVTSKKGSQSSHCFTNPIYLEVHPD